MSERKAPTFLEIALPLNGYDRYATGLLGIALVLYGLIASSLNSGRTWSVLLFAWLAVIVLPVFVAYQRERRDRSESLWRVVRNMFSLRLGRWSYTIGCVVLLPAALLVCADWWRVNVAVEPSLAVLVIGCVVGFAAGFLFHMLHERPVFVRAGCGSSLLAPTKLAHDIAAYSVLFGGLTYAVIPMIMPQVGHLQWSDHLTVVAGCVAVWLLLRFVVDDGLRRSRSDLAPWGYPATTWR